MKKLISALILAVCVTVTLFAAGRTKLPSAVWVSVENAALKEKPGRFGKDGAPLEYGEKLSVIDANGDWYEVMTILGEIGWISSGAVSQKKIVAGRMASANADEISLAGKGFSQEIEDVYRQQYNLDFRLVDAVENVMISDDDLLEFLEKGNLGQGGQR